MNNAVIEANYPLDFRKEEAMHLGEHLAHRHSVDLIGMKRVGISNFLRYFLYNKDIAKTYISKDENHVFIPVDLNDLVEREVLPFWTLTFKRIVDLAVRLDLPKEEQQKIESLFLRSIQLQDVFLTIDSIRQALRTLISHEYVPTIFFLRFDRIRDAITPTFFDNLQGLRDASHRKLSFVFTSYRRLDELAPHIFTKTSLSIFAQHMYIGRAKQEDTQIICETYQHRYGLTLAKEQVQPVLELVNGYVQYLQLCLIILRERSGEVPQTKDEIFRILVQDERIHLQSEELWESLTDEEKQVLLRIAREEQVEEAAKMRGQYLWDTGFIMEKDGVSTVFSPLFKYYLDRQLEKTNEPIQSVHLSKKENNLMRVLEERIGQICEREEIIAAVWPESQELGVSDWAIDRLVARVRSKLKQQESKYEIRTVRTRGYQLVER